MPVPAYPTAALRARAESCARELGHSFIGTEHLLYAACADPVARPLIADTDITPDALREELVALIGRGRTAPDVIEFTPRAGGALDAADLAAHLRGDEVAGALHLIGALSEQTGTVAQVILAEEGIDRTRAEALLPPPPNRAWGELAVSRRSLRPLWGALGVLAIMVAIVRLLRW